MTARTAAAAAAIAGAAATAGAAVAYWATRPPPAPAVRAAPARPWYETPGAVGRFEESGRLFTGRTDGPLVPVGVRCRVDKVLTGVAGARGAEVTLLDGFHEGESGMVDLDWLSPTGEVDRLP